MAQKMMKLYLLKRDEDMVDYDEYIGFIIAASSEDEARVYADEENHHAGWTKVTYASCVMISPTSIYREPTTVLDSFKAG